MFVCFGARSFRNKKLLGALLGARTLVGWRPFPFHSYSNLVESPVRSRHHSKTPVARLRRMCSGMRTVMVVANMARMLTEVTILAGAAALHATVGGLLQLCFELLESNTFKRCAGFSALHTILSFPIN